MPRMKDPIAGNTYKYNSGQIEVMEDFLYRVDIYSTAKRKSSCLSSRYYISKTKLNCKEVEVVKRFKNFIIERFITLIGAPKSFIKEYNLPIYEKRTH